MVVNVRSKNMVLNKDRSIRPSRFISKKRTTNKQTNQKQKYSSMILKIFRILQVEKETLEHVI